MHPSKLNIRTLLQTVVLRAIREHGEDVACVADVIALDALRGMNALAIQVAVCDLVSDGQLEGFTGTGRIRAVEPSAVIDVPA